MPPRPVLLNLQLVESCVSRHGVYYSLECSVAGNCARYWQPRAPNESAVVKHRIIVLGHRRELERNDGATREDIQSRRERRHKHNEVRIETIPAGEPQRLDTAQ